MNAREFRIGNLINYRIQDNLDEKKDWFEVSKIDATDLVVLENNIDYDYQPIPLTEEWLIRFGFKRFCKDFQLNGIIIHTRKRGFVLKKSVPIIHHVHQLQNLFYALTGKELELKN